MPDPTESRRDERVSLPLDPEIALRALLAVDPDDEPDRPTDDVDRHDDAAPTS